jgi:cell division protein FtsA
MILWKTKAITRRPFAVLDIGSSKICCMIGEADGVGGVRLLGHGTHASAGIRTGEVSDLDALSTAIGKTVQIAEREAGTSVHSATVVVAGGKPVSGIHKQTLKLSDAVVRRRDIDRLMAKDGTHAVPQNYQAMHVQTLQYGLDEVRGISDPRGMRGSSLSVDYTLVCGLRTSLANFREALALNHLETERFLHAGYAAGIACLTSEERDLGSVIIDMGGGTTSIAIFMEGKLVYVDTIMIGGHHVTTDIARILSTPLADAERLKAIDGSVMPIEVAGEAPDQLREVMRMGRSDNITIPSIGNTTTAIGGKTIERNLLSAIIRPRVEEILELLQNRMAKARMEHTAGSRYVLTGGASQLTGLGDLFARQSKKSIGTGKPIGIAGLDDNSSGPGYAASIGGLIHVSRLEDNDPDDRQTRTLPHGPFERIGAWLRDNL